MLNLCMSKVQIHYCHHVSNSLKILRLGGQVVSSLRYLPQVQRSHSTCTNVNTEESSVTYAISQCCVLDEFKEP